MRDSKRIRGFSLVELMVTITIIGLLAAIAIPQYGKYTSGTRRADAMTALSAASAAFERYRSNNGFNYGGASLQGGPGTVIFTNQVPTEGGTAYYNLELRNGAGAVVNVLPAGATTYSIRAVPTGVMAGQDGPLTIDNAGRKTWTNKGGVTINCWPAGMNTSC